MTDIALVFSPKFQLIEKDILVIVKSGALSTIGAIAAYLLTNVQPADFTHFGAFPMLYFVLFTTIVTTIAQWVKQSAYITLNQTVSQAPTNPELG